MNELAKWVSPTCKTTWARRANGDPFLDFSKLTRDRAAALAEVAVEEFVDGRCENARAVKRVKFKLHDKRAALVDLGRHLGMFRKGTRPAA